MTEPEASRPYMPGYGILDADQGEGCSLGPGPASASQKLRPTGLRQFGRRVASRYAGLGRVAG